MKSILKLIIKIDNEINKKKIKKWDFINLFNSYFLYLFLSFYCISIFIFNKIAFNI